MRALQNGFRVRGIELVSYNGGMTSGGPRGGDRTVEAFDDLIEAFTERDPAPPL